MSLTEQTPRTDVILSTATDVIPFTYQFDADTELLVVSDGRGTLILTTDYTVTGAGTDIGGDVTMVTGVELEKITVLRNTPLSQTLVLRVNGRFFVTDIDSALDKLTKIDQELAEEVARCMKLPVTETGSLVLPEAAARVLKTVAFDNNGDLLLIETLDQTSLDNAVAAAEASAAASAASAAASSASAVGLAASAGESATSAGESATSATEAAGSALTAASYTGTDPRSASIADLRSLATAAYSQDSYVDVLGYYTSGDGGGGSFRWDATSTEADDGGSIIKATGVVTGRWKRQYDEHVSVYHYGAFPDGATDYRSNIQAAIDWAKDKGLRTVLFPCDNDGVDLLNFYLIDSVHPTYTDYGLILPENIRLEGGANIGGVRVLIKAGANLMGKTALIATTPLTNVTSVQMHGITVHSNYLTDFGIQIGDPANASYTYRSHFTNCSSLFGAKACWRVLAFRTIFDNCEGAYPSRDVSRQSSWTPADPTAEGTHEYRCWWVSGVTSISMNAGWATGGTIGYYFEGINYSSCVGMACDWCEVAFALVSCDVVDIQGGCEFVKQAIYTSDSIGCEFHVQGTNLAITDVERDHFSANRTNYLVEILQSSIISFGELTINVKNPISGADVIAPLLNRIFQSTTSVVNYPANVTTGSLKYSNSSDSWSGLFFEPMSPEMIDSDADGSSLNSTGYFTIPAYTGKLRFIDRAWIDQTSFSPLLDGIYRNQSLYKDITSKRIRLTITCAIVFPDGNVGSSFDEVDTYIECASDKWETATLTDAGGGLVNFNSAGHGLANGNDIQISEAYPQYEGVWEVTVVDVDNFTIIANFLSSYTSVGWTTNGFKASATLIRSGDAGGNRVWGTGAANVFYALPNAATINILVNSCFHTMTMGKIVTGFTYKITDLGASFDGSNVFPSGTAETFGDGVKVAVNQIGHGLVNSNPIVISGTTSYNGTKYAKRIDDDNFDVYDDSGLSTPTSYVADEAGDFHTNVLNSTLIGKSTGYPAWGDGSVEATFTEAEQAASPDWDLKTLLQTDECIVKVKSSQIYRGRQTISRKQS